MLRPVKLGSAPSFYDHLVVWPDTSVVTTQNLVQGGTKWKSRSDERYGGHSASRREDVGYYDKALLVT